MKVEFADIVEFLNKSDDLSNAEKAFLSANLNNLINAFKTKFNKNPIINI